MLKKPLLAIITPTYNNGELLKRLYISIKIQSYKELCWIIIDDGSSDKTESIVKSFKEILIIFKKQKNSGPNFSRNRAELLIPKSCKYVIPIDSDDKFYDEETLNQMVYDIKNSKKNIGIIGYSSIDGITGQKLSYLAKPQVEISFLENIRGNVYKGEFLIIQKKKILRYAKWPESIWGYETIRHWEINKHCNFIYKEKPGRIYFRDRKNNLTSPESTISRAEQMIEGIDFLLKTHGEDLQKFALDRYVYFIFTKGLYLLLTNEKIKTLKLMITYMKMKKNFKMFALGFLILLCLPLPVSFINKVYLYIKRMNYNYQSN